MSDPIDPRSFVLSPEELSQLFQNSGGQKSAEDSQKPKRQIHFYKIPKVVFDGLIGANYMPALTVALVVYETWYYDYEHSNPVKLTSRSLKEHGVSKNQKTRALQVLENTGQYIVERSPGRNPLVTMKWMRVKDGAYFR